MAPSWDDGNRQEVLRAEFLPVSIFIREIEDPQKISGVVFRDTLGFEEAWREGEHTVALQLPGSDVRLLIEDDELGLAPGGVFLVESADGFYKENKDQLEFIKQPVSIPPGRYAIYMEMPVCQLKSCFSRPGVPFCLK